MPNEQRNQLEYSGILQSYQWRWTSGSLQGELAAAQTFLGLSRERKFILKCRPQNRKSKLPWLTRYMDSRDGKRKYKCWSHLVPNETGNGWLGPLPTAQQSAKWQRTVGGRQWRLSVHLRKWPLLPERGVRLGVSESGRVRVGEWVGAVFQILLKEQNSYFICKSAWRMRGMFPSTVKPTLMGIVRLTFVLEVSFLFFSSWPVFLSLAHTLDQCLWDMALTAAGRQQYPLVRHGFWRCDTILPRSTWRTWLLRDGKSPGKRS